MNRRGAVMAIAMLALAGCGRQAPADPADARPLPTTMFEGFPLSGNMANALGAGFDGCMDGNYGIRCRKEGVKVMGVGPLSAAVDFDAAPTDAPKRFDHLTLWREGDQSAVLDLGTTLKAGGWQSCLTPDAERYWRPDSPVRIAIDTNYWGIRRVIVSAPPPSATKYC